MAADRDLRAAAWDGVRTALQVQGRKAEWLARLLGMSRARLYNHMRGHRATPPGELEKASFALGILPPATPPPPPSEQALIKWGLQPSKRSTARQAKVRGAA